MKPAWKLKLGGLTLSDTDRGQAEHGFAVTVDLGMGCWAGGFTVWLGSSKPPAVKAGDEASLELGLDGRTEPVTAGRVSAVRAAPGGVAVEVLNGAAQLLAIRPLKVWRSARAGDVVKDLAGLGKVSTGTVDPGIELPAYVADGSLSAFRHIHDLARRSGAEAYMTHENKLQFGAAAGPGKPVTFTFGENILDVSLAESDPWPAGAIAVGEGATGSKGKSKWHWLASDPSESRGEAGQGGDSAVLYLDNTLRSKDAAAKMAKGVVELAKRRAISGTVAGIGAPGVRVAQAIAIAGSEGGALDGTYQVRRVRHRLSDAAGFITEVDFIRRG